MSRESGMDTARHILENASPASLRLSQRSGMRWSEGSARCR